MDALVVFILSLAIIVLPVIIVTSFLRKLKKAHALFTTTSKEDIRAFLQGHKANTKTHYPPRNDPWRAAEQKATLASASIYEEAKLPKEIRDMLHHNRKSNRL